MHFSVVNKIAVSLLLLLICSRSWANINKSHAIALYDEPKYAADFQYFDYVNPDAPKGGSMRTAAQGTFNSFHPYIPKGNAVGTGAVETLMVSSVDEPFTKYGLIAETMEWPDDRSWIIFNLREQARWHDGTPITADDVIWSFDTLTVKGDPQYRFYYSSVERVEKLGERRVKFHFNERNNRELPLIVGEIPILPKHYWQNHDFEKTTLEPPLGSGPYRVADFEAGRYVIQELVSDYWGKDLPVRRGTNNIDRIRTDFYRDDTAIRLALKSGEIDFRFENQAKAWALDYQVPAVEKGWLIQERVKHRLPTGMQGFVFNTRRPLFSDPIVREAIGYAFDFEWTNRNLFFGQYSRTHSYFSNSEMMAQGLPQNQELEVLEKFGDQLPARIFTTPYHVPVTNGDGWSRENLLKADRLLKQAGWVVRDMKRVHGESGEPFGFEILLTSQSFERIMLPMVRNLERLGIDARIRLVDQTQYVNRMRSFDYDMLMSAWGQSESPGNEQRNYWSSKSAQQSGSRNLAGINDAVVDQLVERMIASASRAELVANTRALDRVLLAGFYVIPNWHIPADRVLYWDKYSRPEVAIKSGVWTGLWWFDNEKAARLADRLANDDTRSRTIDEPGSSQLFDWRGLLLLVMLSVGIWSIARYLRGRS
ncbi:MAG: ABC transporter substrate-binding protein [Gammaproteobacteria bacterium]|nr:ABC transporter substrate-binding protein [Gammaproteobacteria bacterium]